MARAQASKAAPVAAEITREDAQRDPRKLRPYPRNPNTHTPEQVDQIAALMKLYGQVQRIVVDENDTIIIGHGRTMAAIKLAWQQVDVTVVRGLTDDQKRALVIADNQVPKNARWDEDLLRLELGELKMNGFDLSLTGFLPEQLVSYMTNPLGPTAPLQFQQFDENLHTEHQCPKCGYQWSGGKPVPANGAGKGDDASLD